MKVLILVSIVLLAWVAPACPQYYSETYPPLTPLGSMAQSLQDIELHMQKAESDRRAEEARRGWERVKEMQKDQERRTKYLLRHGRPMEED